MFTLFIAQISAAPVQGFLTLAIQLIAIAFFGLMAVDFVAGIARLGVPGREELPVVAKLTAMPSAPVLSTQEVQELDDSFLDQLDAIVPVEELPLLFIAEPDPWADSLPVSMVALPLPVTTAPRPVYLLPPAQMETVVPQSEEEDLSVLSIRQLKKLASAAKVKNYNLMTKARLVAALSAA